MICEAIHDDDPGDLPVERLFRLLVGQPPRSLKTRKMISDGRNQRMPPRWANDAHCLSWAGSSGAAGAPYGCCGCCGGTAVRLLRRHAAVRLLRRDAAPVRLLRRDRLLGRLRRLLRRNPARGRVARGLVRVAHDRCLSFELVRIEPSAGAWPADQCEPRCREIACIRYCCETRGCNESVCVSARYD